MSDIQVFAAPAFQAYPNFKDLMRDFKVYKKHHITEFDTVRFGKDVSYNRPASAIAAELRHVHMLPIKSKSNTSDRFFSV